MRPFPLRLFLSPPGRATALIALALLFGPATLPAAAQGLPWQSTTTPWERQPDAAQAEELVTLLTERTGPIFGDEPSEVLVRRWSGVVALVEPLAGPRHPDTLTVLGSLATAQQRAGDVAAAEATLRDRLQRAEAAADPDEALLRPALGQLAVLMQLAGRTVEARQLLERLAASAARHGDDEAKAFAEGGLKAAAELERRAGAATPADPEAPSPAAE